ncbi:efflux RND transporter periplasmic adaptor subunit [bacterium]|nr:efflux RND transporter periplasmic adaptor subunit [bacterium]
MNQKTRYWMSRLGIPVAVIVAAILVMNWLAAMRTDAPRREAKPRMRIVQSQVVELDSVQSAIVAYGRLTSAQPVDLYAEVAGTLLRGDTPFKPAQAFRRGDLLLRVDDRQVRLDLNSAKSDLLNALASVLPEIRVDFPDRYQRWADYFNSCRFDSELLELPEADNQKIKLFLSRYNVYKLYFAVRDLEIQLEKHFFYAPFDGSIVTANLHEGSSVRSGTLIGKIINLEDLEVEIPVASVDLPWISHRSPVRFTSTEMPGVWSGQVKRVGNTIDTRTQTVPVYLSVNERERSLLYDGVFLEASIPGSVLPNAYSVPRSAIYNDTYVYLIQNGELVQQPVEIARRETDRVIVDGGLKSGDTLVVELLQGVASGMPAEPRFGPTMITTGERGE